MLYTGVVVAVGRSVADGVGVGLDFTVGRSVAVGVGDADDARAVARDPYAGVTFTDPIINLGPDADVFRDALPIAGVDGTLRTRMKNTAAENNLRAKTGSLSSAASLGGYVTTSAGEKLAFSIMVNNFSSDVEPRVVCIDPIAVLLASFAGKSN